MFNRIRTSFRMAKAAVEREQAEREEALHLMEAAMAMDKTSEEYLKVKSIVESFMAFRPRATVDEFYTHFSSRKDAEQYNPFLPIVIAADLNEGCTG